MTSLRNITVGVVAGSAVIVGSLYLHRLWKRNRCPTDWHAVGEVTELLCYPIKSCGVIQMDQFTPANLGWEDQFLRDRVFMIVNSETMKFVTARQYPEFVKIQPKIDGSKLILTTEDAAHGELIIDMTEVIKTPKTSAEVWDQPIQVHDCGDEAADWLSKYQKTGLRLVYYPLNVPTRPVRPKNQRSEWPNMTDDHVGAMHDASSYMMLNQASLDDLNAKLENKVAPLWFRPNIVIKGLAPYAEDDIEWFRIGDSTVFRNVKPCSRCIFTTIDPDTGKKDPSMEPLKTLRTYRKIPECGDSPILGAHLGLFKGEGPVKVGDKVYIAKSKQSKTCYKSSG